MKACYIVFEGIQGSGKTDQIAKTAAWLRGQNIAVHTTREPGGADLAARTIRILTQNPTYNLNTKTEVLLYNASRSQLMDVIAGVLSRNVWVLCDRNFLTTLAVQYYARGDVKNYDDIVRICEFAMGDLRPDLTIMLDVPAEVARSRASARYRGERFDALNISFLQRMRRGYLKEARARTLPVIDATKSQDEVFLQVQKLIAPLLAADRP